MTAQADVLRQWSHRLAAEGSRGLAVLAGRARWRTALVAALTAGGSEPPLRLGAGEGVDHALGREAGLTILDAVTGLDVDLLGAAAGTVRAGGLLVVEAPPLTLWHSSRDRVVRRFLSHGQPPAGFTDRFLGRLNRLLHEHPETLLLTPGATPALPPAAQPGPEPAPPADSDCLTRDQADAVAAVLGAARGRAHRPLLLSADRGRGKSTALGIAAARLLADAPDRRILVTAPARGAAARVLERAPLPFRAPDELLRHNHPADLLLVDEAAGIPVPSLLALAARYPRIVFATTVHGYEGTGRGFALRFHRDLTDAGYTATAVTLHQPIRWRAGDPLERFVNEALLLDADPPASGRGEPRVARLDRDALVADEPRLRALFGLLVGAHYRTRPSDLRQLLDAPGIGVTAAEDADGQPVGVALTVDEGPLPDALHESIWLGRRRVRGHLTPQSLAVHAGRPAALALRFRRILRIGVAPALQRQGIGRRLIDAVTADARRQGRDAVSASFGATGDLLAFWRATGFNPARFGHRRDRASGTHSAIVVTPLSGAGAALHAALTEGLAEQLRHHAAGAFSGVPMDVVNGLAGGLPMPSPAETDWWQVATFAVGQRALLDCAPGLTTVAWWVLAGSGPAIAPPDRRLVTAVLMQQMPDAEAAAALGFAGRRPLLARLRALARALAEDAAPASIRRFMAASG